MKYAVLGAGGTGGMISTYLEKGGKNSVLIARGDHCQTIQEKGLQVKHLWDGTEEIIPVKAIEVDKYSEEPDVIFVCVKGYSLESTVPFIRQVASPDTVIIPILNIFGAGRKLQERLSNLYVLDGCIYVSANREAPGRLLQHAPTMRIVFGPRQGQEDREVLAEIESDLMSCNISPGYSHHVERDCLEKFSYVSPIGAAGIYLDSTAGAFQHEGEARELFKAMIREIECLAEVMGFAFEKDYVDIDLKILSGMPPETTTSLQRDVAAGRQSEVDGLVYQVVRMAHKYNVDVPQYEKVAAFLQQKGIK